jgi:hypothetical protein
MLGGQRLSLQWSCISKRKPASLETRFEAKANDLQSLFQCLYSQCDTAHFGSALHHAISQCSSLDSEIILSIPRIPKHDVLRRREAEYLAGAKAFGSGSAIGFPVQSAYPTQSVNNYLTQSAGSAYTMAATSTPPYFPLLNTKAGPVGPSATSTEEAAVAVSTTAGPLLYTGAAPEIGPSIILPLLMPVAACYLSLWRTEGMTFIWYVCKEGCFENFLEVALWKLIIERAEVRITVDQMEVSRSPDLFCLNHSNYLSD